MVLFAVVLGSDEEGFESGPVLEHGWAFTPFVTVFVEETCGFNVVIRPPHELRVVYHLITFGCEELAVIKLVKQGFNGGWWGPGGFHSLFVQGMICVVNFTVRFPNVL